MNTTCTAIASTILATGVLIAAPAAAEMIGEPFEYTVGDEDFEGYIAYNSDLEETRGTVLIVHDWDGLTEYEMTRADMLAALGYTAVAIDVYGADVEPQSAEENRELSGALYEDRELFRQRLMGSMEAAAEQPGVTDDMIVMGYCFGGSAVLEMARAGADLDGFVSFHGGLATPEGQDYSGAEGPILVLHGSADPSSSMADFGTLIAAMREAGVEHDAEVYGNVRHSFTVWGSDDYDLEADRNSWMALQQFLNERFGAES
jgi:dienelactone hydrolase